MIMSSLYAGLKPRPIKVVAVLGGGLMGSGIATALVLAGVNVLLKEVNQQFLDVRNKRVLLLLCGRYVDAHFTSTGIRMLVLVYYHCHCHCCCWCY
jgi:hypothetical protein